MKLTGDRNQCPACGLYFNSTGAFDKHRVPVTPKVPHGGCSDAGIGGFDQGAGMTWTDSSFRQGRDDPSPVEYRWDASMWPLVGITIIAASALAVLYGLVWLWRHFPGLWT